MPSPTVLRLEAPAMRFLILLWSRGAVGPVGLHALRDPLAQAGVLLDAALLEPVGATAANGDRAAAGADRAQPAPAATMRREDAGGAQVAGYALVDLRSTEEAREWARRLASAMPEEAGLQIDVRRAHPPDGWRHAPESAWAGAARDAPDIADLLD